MTEWQPIETAIQDIGVEILGSRWSGGTMVKEPFITFWSPTMSKFYLDPTHWVPQPAPPESGT